MAWSASSALLLLALTRFEAAEPHMGTLFRITLYARDRAAADTAFRAGFDRVQQLDEILSDYNPQSELMRVCAAAHQRPVRVSAELFDVLAASQHLAEATGGAFDVTLGPVIRLWRDARKQKRLPDAAALAEARGRCGYRNLALDAGARTVSLKMPGMLLDLGGIAKGYAADEALRVLRNHGIKSALVAASGDLAIGDPPPGKKGWRVGIDSRNAPDARFTKVLELRNTAVSTSGDTQQFLEIGGVRYSHIIDPATGMGLTKRIAVTVIAEKGIDADGFATAVSLLGSRRGMEFVARRTSAAVMIVDSGGRVSQSSRFPQR
ncbi:MAG: FAD:protein FMN transferase [Candidatus Solibacter usitatus]|nr:FAD:protein FMN transferase [Candidatus Solibacter usitatus]